MTDLLVWDNAGESRFEAEVDGHSAVADYRLDDEVITFLHTLVPPELEGRGVGSALVRAALASARSRGLRVIPRCPFFAAYIAHHPEEQDLVDPQAGGA